jgi:hypothetical protein
VNVIVFVMTLINFFGVLIVACSFQHTEVEECVTSVSELLSLGSIFKILLSALPMCVSVSMLSVALDTSCSWQYRYNSFNLVC